MPTSMYDLTVPLFRHMLGNLQGWLDKAKAEAERKGYPVDNLVTARLAPDQYDLRKQVQAACDTAKFTVARVTGTPPPVHADTEQTFPELAARVASALAFVESVPESAFEGAEERVVPLPFRPGKGAVGRSYVRDLQLPNFFFHLNHVYAILRHNGVPLGKSDVITRVDLVDV
ncbi:MAG: DUF1993 domain-containing protein [Deltaproteobacteria bacterium]|nr:DUF1993 domain-containing protein [Deltaproteobacteria bacterium]